MVPGAVESCPDANLCALGSFQMPVSSVLGLPLAIWSTYLFPGVAPAQFRSHLWTPAPVSWCGHGSGSIASWLGGAGWRLDPPCSRLGLCSSAPGSLSSGRANSLTSGTVRPRWRPQTNGPLSFGHGSWFVWPDPPDGLCARSSGQRELCGETQWSGGGEPS